MRIKTYKKRIYLAVMVPFLILGIGVLGLAILLTNQGRENREADTKILAHTDEVICNAVNDNRESFRNYVSEVFQGQKETLPTLRYYQENPDELEDALKRIEEQEEDLDEKFTPLPCDTLAKTGEME